MIISINRRVILAIVIFVLIPFSPVFAEDPSADELGDVAAPEGVDEQDVQRIFRLITGEEAATPTDSARGDVAPGELLSDPSDPYPHLVRPNPAAQGDFDISLERCGLVGGVIGWFEGVIEGVMEEQFEEQIDTILGSLGDSLAAPLMEGENTEFSLYIQHITNDVNGLEFWLDFQGNPCPDPTHLTDKPNEDTEDPDDFINYLLYAEWAQGALDLLIDQEMVGDALTLDTDPETDATPDNPDGISVGIKVSGVSCQIQR